MTAPVGEWRRRVADIRWLDATLGAGGAWPHGPVAAVDLDRIGAGYGLSGEVYRLHCSVSGGRGETLVAKIEPAVKLRRACTVRQHVEASMSSSMPGLLGVELASDGDDGALGVILLDDVSPAEQGDEFDPVDRDRAADLVGVVAQLHSIPVAGDTTAERWSPGAFDDARWAARLEVVGDRYGDDLDADAWAALRRLGDTAGEASATLADGPFRWTHVDPHWDNVLWRSDGSTVLLDWSNARIGPPAQDLAVIAFSSCFVDRPCWTPEELLSSYAASGRDGPAVGPHDLASALTLHVRGVTGWAGMPDDIGGHERARRLRDGVMRRVRRSLRWSESVCRRSRSMRDRARSPDGRDGA